MPKLDSEARSASACKITDGNRETSSTARIVGRGGAGCVVGVGVGVGIDDDDASPPIAGNPAGGIVVDDGGDSMRTGSCSTAAG